MRCCNVFTSVATFSNLVTFAFISFVNEQQPSQLDTPVQPTSSFLSFIGADTQPTEQQEIDTTSYYPDGYENSWGNRFAIGVDNTQASLFKGLGSIIDKSIFCSTPS